MESGILVATGEAVERRVLHVRVDSTTDDVERMIAAVQVLTEKNPTGRPRMSCRSTKSEARP